MNRSFFVQSSIVAITFAIAILMIPFLPRTMASHWNEDGDADGYSSKYTTILLVPLLMIGILVMFQVLPLMDPLKKNVAKFRKYYDWLCVSILIFMSYIFILIVLWNMMSTFNIVRWLIPAFSILFFFIGKILMKTKRNWFVGIRTPWTLSSDGVWDKTHNMGGKLFQLAALMALVGFFFPVLAIWFIIIPILTVSLITVIYSYYVFKFDQ